LLYGFEELIGFLVVLSVAPLNIEFRRALTGYKMGYLAAVSTEINKS
jgi:hypothetical protein